MRQLLSKRGSTGHVVASTHNTTVYGLVVEGTTAVLISTMFGFIDRLDWELTEFSIMFGFCLCDGQVICF